MSSRPVTPELTNDEAAVVACTLDYFNGWLDGDSHKMDRVLHPALAKRSLGQVDADSDELRTVTKDQMVAWTAEGEGKEADPGGQRDINVEVIDLYGNMASVVVRSPGVMSWS